MTWRGACRLVLAAGLLTTLGQWLFWDGAEGALLDRADRQRQCYIEILSMIVMHDRDEVTCAKPGLRERLYGPFLDYESGKRDWSRVNWRSGGSTIARPEESP